MASKTSGSAGRDTMTAELRTLLNLQASVQGVIVRYSEERRMRTTVHDDLYRLGLPYEVTTEGEHIKVQDIEVPTEINGTSREDYTDAALRRMDQAALDSFRQRVWDFFRRGIRDSQFTEEDGLAYLGELGFTLPEQATQVGAETPDGFVGFRLDGRVDREEVERKLNEQYELPVVAKVQAAFAGAADLPVPVPYVTVSHVIMWDAAAEANGLKNR